jgi:phosphate transport system substrate-binding protein
MKYIVPTLFLLIGSPVLARDHIQIAGSSTVLPYATIVAEAFGENFNFPTPVVESGGSSAGLKRFCEGVGETKIDIANSSRPIKETEIKTCADNGVISITEILIGYDGIIFANARSGNSFALTPKDVYLALGAESTATYWDEVNPTLPHQEILVFIPGTKHGTREVFEEKVMVKGCDKENHKECVKVRTDGRAIDIDGDYTETLARIASNPDGMGVFGLSFYENNTDKLQVATMNSIMPSVETIATGEYPVSRPLYFYVKNAHLDVIPGLREYVQFFISDEISGPEGPLATYGLVPDPNLSYSQKVAAGL